MQLHTIPKNKNNKRSQRIGRGGKRGTYSGRGIKGQKARAGHRIRPAIRDLMLRTPKLRGYAFSGGRNRPSVILSLAQIEKKFDQKTTINPKALAQKGLMPHYYVKGATIKILGDGTLTHPHEFSGVNVSARAKEKIISTGGTVK